MAEKWKREVTIRLGNDCIYGVCRSHGCPGKLGLHHQRSHGISGESWIYSLRGSEGALVLTVSTDIYPLTVPASHFGPGGLRPLNERRRGSDISFHLQVEIGEKCDYVGGRCLSNWSSALQADELFKEFGDPSQAEPQPDRFWEAMGSKYQVALDSTRAEEKEALEAERTEYERLRKKFEP